MARVVQNPFYPDFSVTMALITDINNATGLRKCVMSGTFEATLLNTAMILDEFQLISACNQALHNLHHKKLITKNVHTEILYRLSPSKNISDSFKKFGMTDTAQSLCVVVVNDIDNSVLNQIVTMSGGKITELTSLSEFADLNLIKKVYNISNQELHSGSIVDGLVSRIASKDIVTV